MDTPDYSRYTLEELHDARTHVDVEAFPDRAALIDAQIQARSEQPDAPTLPPATDEATDWHSVKPSLPKWRPSDLALRLWGLVSSGVLLSATTAHVLTFMPNHGPLNWAWPIHGAIFVPFGAMVIAQISESPSVKRERGQSLFSWIRMGHKTQASSQKELLAATPVWLRLLSGLVIAYVVFNFLHFTMTAKNADPSTSELIRGFSGHWILFSLIPTVYFLSTAPRLRDRRQRGWLPTNGS